MFSAIFDFTLLTLVAFFTVAVSCQENYCYSTDPIKAQHNQCALKKSYYFAEKNSSDFIVPNCKPVKLWMIIRHGIRLPKFDRDKSFLALEELRDKIVINHKMSSAQCALCEADLKALEEWHWNKNVNLNTSFGLTQQGYNEVKLLANRFQEIFPDILTDTYNEKDFFFAHTKTQRAEASFKAFSEGLFGERSSGFVKSVRLPENDTILSPYFNCEKWSLHGSIPEMKLFEETQIFRDVVESVSSRFGFNYSIGLSEIETIFDICCYDVAWNVDHASPWCSAFLPSDFDVLEYWSDLDAYYRKSFGFDINERIECELAQDMMNHFKMNNPPKTNAFFAHSSTFILFLTLLGAAKDDIHLRANNYIDMQNRRFKTSILSPFAANLAAVKYECVDEMETEKIKFFLNENILNFDWCEDGLCNLRDFEKRYEYFANADCPNVFCKLPEE